MASFISRVLVMVFGYVYPAYECFKTVEKKTPDMTQIVFWCKYWILVALLTVCERFADTFISWFPLYGEAKVALFICLWYPRARGSTSTAYLYGSLLRPYVSRHEKQIDSTLLDVKTRGSMFAVYFWQKALCFGQTKFIEIMEFASSQSKPSSVKF